MAIFAVALAAIAFGAAAAGAANPAPIVIAEPLHVDFRVGFPSKLAKKPQPVPLSLSGRVWTDDGSHIPALSELEMKLDRHLLLGVEDLPVCAGGTLNVRRQFLEGCEDAIVGRGSIEVEVAFPEQPLVSVKGTLTIYNRGRKPGGFDLGGWAYFPAPITGAIAIPVRVRRFDGGRYGWRARIEIPKLAGGSGSIARFSARLSKRIVSARCPDGKLQVGTTSVFTDGTTRFITLIHSCSMAKAHTRQ